MCLRTPQGPHASRGPATAGMLIAAALPLEEDIEEVM